MEEAFRDIEALDVLEAVQQPVGVGGIAVRLELPEPDEPRDAGVGRLFEQMLEVAPKPGRDPLGDARFDPALRVDQRVGAEPLDRRRGRQDGSRAAAGIDEPAHQVLVRLRLFPFFSEPLDELTRRTAREGPESVQAAQLSKMLVPGLGPDRVVGEVVPVQVELASDENPRRPAARTRPGGPGWRSTHSCRAKPSLFVAASPSPDVQKVLVAQGVVAQQVRVALRQGEQGRPLPAERNGPRLPRGPSAARPVSEINTSRRPDVATSAPERRAPDGSHRLRGGGRHHGPTIVVEHLEHMGCRRAAEGAHAA